MFCFFLILLLESGKEMHLLLVHLDYVLQNSVNKIKKNGFTHRQAKTRRYQAKTITSADYVNDLALFTSDLAVFADDIALFAK